MICLIRCVHADGRRASLALSLHTLCTSVATAAAPAPLPKLHRPKFGSPCKVFCCTALKYKQHFLCQEQHNQHTQTLTSVQHLLLGLLEVISPPQPLPLRALRARELLQTSMQKEEKGKKRGERRRKTLYWSLNPSCNLTLAASCHQQH